MHKQLITLHNSVHFQLGTDAAKPVPSARSVGMKRAQALNAEVATLGFTFDPQLIGNYARINTVDFNVYRALLLSELGAIKGAAVKHDALYAGFPYDTPDHRDYLVKRVIGYIQNVLGLMSNQTQVLSCGHVIDLRLFDLQKFGACPICQRQVDELRDTGTARYDFQSITPLRVLRYIDTGGVRGLADALLMRNASLSQDERDFLTSARVLGGLTRPSQVFRENLPFVYSFFGDINYTKSLLSGATDVMRIATYLSDPKGDLSLKEPVRFKLSTKHRKNMLRLLESRPSITEDLMRHRERWIHLAEVLHPGTAKNTKLYPNTAWAFCQLRVTPDRIPTLNRFIETRVRARVVDRDLLQALSARPGEFMRRLDFILRESSTTVMGDVTRTLSRVVEEVPLKRLFEMSKYLTHRADTTLGTTNLPMRLFVPKGRINKLQIVPDRRPFIVQSRIDAALICIREAIRHRLANMPRMGKVFVDPRLEKIVMPFNRRGDTAATSNVTKGSRYACNAPVIRLFTWWKGDSVDVDLSMIAFNESFTRSDIVSWQRTQSARLMCLHSGDIQSAPRGAAEFVDVDPAVVMENGYRYVAMSVLVFRGGPFKGFPCFAGFMERDAMKSGAKFEPQAVALKFDLKDEALSMMPLMFDVVTHEVIYVGISVGGNRFGMTTMGGVKKFATMMQATLQLPQMKPSVGDILRAHVNVRGKAACADKADVVYMLENLNLEHIMDLTKEPDRA